MTSNSKAEHRVLVTGAGGNLGQKVIEALTRADWCKRVIGIDRSGDYSKFSPHARTRLSLVKGDLTRREGEWLQAMQDVDTVLHFAALNPVPDASWQQAMASYDMTLNLLLEAARSPRMKRFVFVSSNHAVGAYKDPPLSDQMGPGKLTDTVVPAPGTRWFNGTSEIHSLAYGTSKVMGEKLCDAVTELTGGRFETVSIRIGWALTGDNRPEDITHSGTPAASADAPALDEESRRALRWFRNMWLSNDDLDDLFLKSVSASSADWPSRSIIVNGVSDNTNMDWDLTTARQYLGYAPKDDVYRHVAA